MDFLNYFHTFNFWVNVETSTSSLCAFPYHTPSMNLHANPHLSHSEVCLDEQLVYCDVQSSDKTIPQPIFAYARNLSCWSQEHVALICFLYNTLFSFPSLFDYFWSLVRYFSLFVIVLLFVIHFLVCSCYLSFFFANALFVCILFLQYFSFCYYFSSLVGVHIYLCISCSLFLFHYFLCLCLLSLTKSSKGNSYQYSPTEPHR